MTTSVQQSDRRALVLGGGGVTGIAWELGVLHGVAEQADDRPDLTTADVVIGTSAGSVVGAQITSGRTLEELWIEQTKVADSEIGASLGIAEMMQLMVPMLGRGTRMEKRARLGAAAKKAQPGPADARLDVIRRRIGDIPWPERELKITAVDADTGHLEVFTRTSGVDLVHAVAASCAVPIVWPPVRIGDRTFIDGGARSASNADLALGTDVVLVLAPLPGSAGRHHRLSAQLARSGARRTAVVSPDKPSLRAIGRNVLDPKRRVGAALAGYAQGRRIADEVLTGWNGQR